MIEAKVTLTRPEGTSRQFEVTTGSGHRLLVDDSAGATGPKPIELVAAALAGCTAFDVIGILRKKRQKVTDYEVSVSAEQAPDPAAGVHPRTHCASADRRGSRSHRSRGRHSPVRNQVLLGRGDDLEDRPTGHHF